MNSIARLITFILFAVAFTSLMAQDEFRRSTGRSIRQWIIDLDNDDYEVRQNATRELVHAGSRAVPWFRQAAESPSLEVVVRSVLILSQMTLEQDVTTKRLAQNALVELAASTDRRVARRASREIDRQQRRLIAQLERLGASVDETDGRVAGISFDGSSVKDEDLSVLRHFPDVVSLSLGGTQVGDAGMKYVKTLSKLEILNLYQSQVGNEGLKHLKTLRNLKWLPIGETKVTDVGLFHLRNMTQLEYLGLRADDITDEGLVHLKALKNLTGLFLGETKVTDNGLVHIRHMDKMDYLRLYSVRVTDVGLVHLRRMTKMTRIDVHDTGITAAGVNRLKTWFPDCKVVHTKPES